ncbi:hypothetical protein [Halorubellus litoreus]|uniref:Uncharacterized protein n=1 Tax=Halorubellus litoreus TaxID=755308 RepID=A0ABD5VMV5_9EURY
MKDERSTRRRILAAVGVTGTIGVSGCLRLTGSEEPTSTATSIKDSDGDGVIDSEDYAPRDPDVQEESDVENDDATTADADPTETETETETRTEETAGAASFGDDFEDGTYDDTWAVTRYHEEEELEESGGVLRYNSPVAATQYASDMAVRTKATIEATGTHRFEATHRVTHTEYDGIPIFRVFATGTDSLVEIREHRWSSKDRFYVRGPDTGKVRLDESVDDTGWMEYAMTVDFDENVVRSVSRDGTEYDVDVSFAPAFESYTLGIGDGGGEDEYEAISVERV